MKFTVNSKSLKELIAPMIPLAAPNQITPICETIYFGIEQSNLTLKATNLSESIVRKGEVQATEAFEFCVDAKSLFQLLTSLPDCPLETEYKNSHILIDASTGKYKLPILKADDFVIFPDVTLDITHEISSKLLTEALHYAGWSYSNDQLRPAMNGVLFEITEDLLTLVSTDANKLAKAEISQKFDQTGNYIIPGKGLANLIKLLPKDSTIEFSFNERNVTFYFDNVVYHIKLIDERFPEYRNAVPQNQPYTMFVNRAELISCLNRMSFVFQEKGTHHFLMNITADKVSLIASNKEIESEFIEALPCEFTGDELSIGFNADLLKTSIQRFTCERICFALKQTNFAAIILSEDEDEKHVLHLVMPIRLNENL